MRILFIHGPNLNMLGKREMALYGDKSLGEIDVLLQKKAKELSVQVSSFQSNSEGSLIDFIQAQSPTSDSIIINPGALTHYGLSLRDALLDCGLPVIEIHLSNIYAREEWRRNSVVAPIATGQISGLGWRGYIAALEIMVAALREES